ncbi:MULTISPECIES: AraC family transcriptional regulator [unclassified Rhizobacter]|uniref:AraC family transcriptional regulator n=1 Tax=unclassified Rhizobacter TaxID=2640088 RepID=UPI0006F9AA1D|nr:MULTISPECIES: AraC family transcriptional regulator [unclassified Rhizobacter]KQU78087.1 AraC family transcriptional regulator [Rhizobacter sp. Root29]KQW15833.1 AraC family transcriptional regulator [Rhizobacter sp. Root1238]KRB24946.1 AraC family transcriptional regulator [Rhizobacter sp. Root16D2]
MEAVPDRFEHASDRAQFKQPAHRGGIELYRAHIVRYAFEPHTHEAYGFGVIDAGVERFRYRGSEHLAPPQSLVVMNPDVLHTGRAETVHGWRYRMAYVDAALLREVSGEADWSFAEPVLRHAASAQRAGAALQALWTADSALAFDGALLELVQAVQPHARRGRPERASECDAPLQRAIDLMHDRLADPLTLADLAQAAGLSPFHFQRRFKARHHATPHQMLMALRLFRAKRQLSAGIAPALVAADNGLTDQAHLTRRFAGMYGVTPARYQQQTRAITTAIPPTA